MREILFRGKRVDNGEWVKGYYFEREEHSFIMTDSFPFNEEYNREPMKIIAVEVIPETVGQYTGLKDKNGKMIFEGDIIDVSYFLINNSGIVKFGKYKSPDMSNKYPCGHLGFYIEIASNEKFVRDTTRQDILFFANNCKIIGNIHDNPKLLESE